MNDSNVLFLKLGVVVAEERWGGLGWCWVLIGGDYHLISLDCNQLFVSKVA